MKQGVLDEKLLDKMEAVISPEMEDRAGVNRVEVQVVELSEDVKTFRLDIRFYAKVGYTATDAEYKALIAKTRVSFKEENERVTMSVGSSTGVPFYTLDVSLLFPEFEGWVFDSKPLDDRGGEFAVTAHRTGTPPTRARTLEAFMLKHPTEERCTNKLQAYGIDPLDPKSLCQRAAGHSGDHVNASSTHYSHWSKAGSSQGRSLFGFITECDWCGFVYSVSAEKAADDGDKLCPSCEFWNEQLNERAGAYVIDGSHYRAAKDKKGGFGNHKAKIELLNGEVISTELWYQGTIPDAVRPLLPDNAKFV